MDEPDSALAAYERAVNAKGLGTNSGRDVAPTLRRMGELYEARGEREKAKEYYSRFVALWRDADDLPAVQDVTRLAGGGRAQALSQGATAPLQVLIPNSVYNGQVPTMPVRSGTMPR
jgi:tetratricopeptide (TPR) repeat protein